jgi:methylated-DNA-[protein]-cysteine S-methyltransferase
MPALYPDSLVLPTPLGVALAVRADQRGIVASDFVRTTRTSKGRIADPLLRETAAQVKAYFRKRLRRFDIPLHFEGTPFQKAVWSFVAALETGELISYSDLARAIDAPRAARGVAAAMARSPLDLFIPAHRVVGADGTVRGAAPRSLRRKLLEFEGITLR